MRKFINLVAFAAILFVPSLAKAQLSLPVTMDFESGLGSWTIASAHSSTGISTLAAHNGSSSFQFFYSTNPPQYLISPELDPLINPAQVEFWYQAYSDYYTESFQVGYSTTTADPTAFTWGPEVTSNVTSWQKYEGFVPAGTKYVSIKYTAYDQFYLFIDDIIIQDPPTCLPVTNIVASNITSDGLTLSWTDAMNTGASYSIDYWADADTNTVTTTDTFYSFTGFNAMTAYHFAVKAVCSSDDSSVATSATIRTGCGAMAMPFYENFDNYDNGLFPPCWHRLKAHGTDPSVNNVFHSSGTMSMYLQDYQDTNIFVTPDAIPLPGNAIQVSYKAYMDRGNATQWIKAGVMTDTADRSTFIALDSVGYHDFNYEFEEHDFNTATLDPTASYWVVWMFYSSYSPYYSGRGGIDDISITQLTGCVRPASASVGTVGARQVELAWNAVAGASSYTVYYGTVNNPTSSSLLTATSNDTTFTLTGLNPETRYYVWVATDCGGSESDLRYAGTFTTLVSCPPVTALAVVDSLTTTDGATIVWHPGDLETEWAVVVDDGVVDVVNDTTYTMSGFNALTSHTVYVSAVCGMDDTSAVRSVSFVTECDASTCNLTVYAEDSYGDGWNGNTIEAWQAGALMDSYSLSSGSHDTASLSVCSSAPVELRFTSGNYADEMSGRVTDGGGSTVFTIENMNSYNTGSLLATVNNPCPACIMPLAVVLDSASANEAFIHWVGQAGQDSWFVKLGNADAVSVSDTNYTFTGLSPQTTYTVYVATDCNSDTSNYYSMQFTTDCANGSCNITVTSTSNYAYSVYCPTLHVWQNGTEVASVNAATQSVNVCAGTPVSIIYEEPTYNWGDNPSATVTDGINDVVFNAGTDGYNTGDTLVTLENACPSCVRPANLHVTYVDSTTLVFNWDEDPNVYGYLISFDNEPYSLSIGGTATYSALNPNTMHTFSVKAVCDIADTSTASTLSWRTSCGMMTLPFTEDFESYSNGDMPSCWSVVRASNAIGVNNDNPHSGSKALHLTASPNDTSMVATSAVPLNGDSLYVSFYAAIASGHILTAGVMTDPLYDSTFIPLRTITDNGGVQTLYDFNTASLTGVHNTTFYVAFLYYCNGISYQYTDIDDINITTFNGCSYPYNLTATPGTNHVDLDWSGNASTMDYVVEYRSGNGAWIHEVDSLPDTNYSIYRLSAATMYEARVGLVCGGDTLWTAPVSFTTNCGLMSVPYFEDFDSYAVDVMPPCWGWSSISATHWDGGVFLRANYGGGNDYVVVPELDGNITKLKIEFDAKVGTIAENDGILIGVADAGGTLIAWIDTIQDVNFSRNAHVHKTVYFTNYNIPANAARVAFAQLRNWNEWALIDNISIDVLPDCYPVDNLTGHELDDPENPRFTWHPMGTETQWQVYVDTVTVDIDSLNHMPSSNFITVYDSSYTIPTGMIQGGGIYNFFVRSDCGMDQSNWVKYEFGAGSIVMNASNVADTVTGCGFVVYDNGGSVAGYLAPSESALVLRSENAGSQLRIFGGKFGFGSSPATLTVYDGEGTTGTVLYTYNTVEGRDTILDSTLCVTTTGAMTITFSCTGNMAHTGYELYVRCTEGAVCPRPTELQGVMTSATTADVTWNGTAPNYNFYYRVHDAATWVRQATTTTSITLTGLTADTTYDMYVVALCTATDSSTASMVRSLNTHYDTVGPVVCNAPYGLTVTNIGTTSAVIGWTTSGTETSWRLEVNGNSNTVANMNPYTLTGLTPATQYTVTVRAICNNGSESAWSTPLTFTTAQQNPDTNYFTITVSSNNTAMGNVTGGGTYAENTIVTLRATSNPGYHFDRWNDNNTDSVRDVTVTADMDFVAYFASNEVGIDEVNGEHIALYPNPASSTVTLTGLEGIATVTVVDMNGRTVASYEIRHSKLEFDVSSLTSGAYFVRMTGEKSTVIRKLIVR